MSDNSYCAYRDGKFVEVPKIEELCLALKDKFMRQEECNQYLSEENKKTQGRCMGKRRNRKAQGRVRKDETRILSSRFPYHRRGKGKNR